LDNLTTPKQVPLSAVSDNHPGPTHADRTQLDPEAHVDRCFSMVLHLEEAQIMAGIIKKLLHETVSGEPRG
jgi:hypothetical protein